MRYLQVATVSFTDASGNTRPVKDLREIPAYAEAQVVVRRAEEALDEVAVRPTVYGAGGELQSYKLAEANAAAIIDAGFDLAALRRLRAPA